MASKILIVEDDSDIVELLTYNLQEAGFETEAVFNGGDAIERAVEVQPALIILDLMLPEVDGLEVCRLLKQDTQTADIPIIMLTAKGEEIDRVIGLQLGADDYVTKPFSQREFVLRVRAVLRRTTAEQPSSSSNQLEIAGLRIDIDRHKVFNEQGEIELTATEFKMLALFAGAPGRVFSRSVLMDSIWGTGLLRRRSNGGYPTLAVCVANWEVSANGLRQCMALAIGSRSRGFASFTQRVIVAYNFPGFGMENCAVTARWGKVNVRPHCQGCVCVNHAIVSKVWVVGILYLFNVVAVAVELDSIAVNNDIPIPKQTLCNLVNKKRLNLGRWVLGCRCRLFVNFHLPAPVSKLWYQIRRFFA